MGFMGDAAIGAGLGVGYVYVLKFTGKDHALMKGIGYGHGAWTILLGGAKFFLGGAKIFPLSPKSVMSNYLEHTLYGLGAYLAATTLGDEDLFAKEDIDKPGMKAKLTSPLHLSSPEVPSVEESLH